MNVLTIGGATLDMIIAYDNMETMEIQRPEATLSYLLLQEGAKIEVTSQQAFSGGGATNAAVSLKKLGLDVSFFGKVGNDYPGTVLLNELSDHGIDTQLVRYSKDYNTATSYVVPSLRGDRTIFAYRGANRHLLTEDLPQQAIEWADFVYVTSLSQASAARLPEIVNIAQQNNTKVAINPGMSQLRAGKGFIKKALHGIDTLILNYEEAKQLMFALMSTDENRYTEHQLNHEENLLQSKPNYQEVSKNAFHLKSFFRQLLGLGPRIVVVTDGGNGVYVATDAKMYFHKAQPVDHIINTLGAGDAFGSTFSGAIYQGQSIEKAIQFGLVNSASVIQHPDAKTGLLDLASIQAQVDALPALMEVIDW